MTIVDARNPVRETLACGQSIWYDGIGRSLLDSGAIARMVEDGVRGVTSNPAIFEQAIAGSDDYAQTIADLRDAGIRSPKAIYEVLAVRDVQDAADLLRPVYDETDGADGYVSLEVSPALAHDADGTVAEAERLWRAVERPNLMIKVPATPAGIEAFETLVARGISVNVTLLFSARVYEDVARAYMRGLEHYDGDPSRVASVASFFVSRVDAASPGAAIPNARYAYTRAQELYASGTWAALAARGARPQRLLWASTGTKDPSLRDTLYVEELIGAETVNTVPPATYDAFRAHGRVRPSLEESAGAPVDEEIASRLLEHGLQLFREAFYRLLAAVAKRSVDPARLWERDASLWTGGDEAKWLGWLDAPAAQLAQVDELRAFADELREAGFTHAVLLGMGGSSLFPALLAKTFGSQPGYPELRILDSTDPAQIAAVEASVDLERTLFVVSSKSGSTLEPQILMQYFLARFRPARFVAVTDPGTALERFATEQGFRRVFSGDPTIGGRYSALSAFGMVPAAIAGLDVEALLGRAGTKDGHELGAAIGAAASAGRDKLTLVVSPGLADFGAWLEQLLAESTGKHGTGVVPVDREPLGSPEVYGDDRLFVHVRLDATHDEAVGALHAAGHPVVTIDVADVYDLGAEVFRWEIATAVAGAVLGIDPFDQPDVEASKIATRALTEEYERTGALPEDASVRPDDVDALRAHLASVRDGDYVALLAYLPMFDEHERVLTEIRTEIRDATGAATCVGFGPRFLHSTGQAYKGGPNSGVFLQLTCDDANDLDVPGRRYTFGVVKSAQARGDLAVLAERGRRVLHVHLGPDIEAGLASLREAVRTALS